MTTKRMKRRGQQHGPKAPNIPVPQGDEGYKVGPGHPPKEHQFQPGESGNPDGSPRHRTNLWVYFTDYMRMTAEQRAAIDQTKLTAAQETALKMVEKAVKGKGCGFERLAKYVIDREEGKAAEHIIVDGDAGLTDAECDEVRSMILERQSDFGRSTE